MWTVKGDFDWDGLAFFNLLGYLLVMYFYSKFIILKSLSDWPAVWSTLYVDVKLLPITAYIGPIVWNCSFDCNICCNLLNSSLCLLASSSSRLASDFEISLTLTLSSMVWY